MRNHHPSLSNCENLSKPVFVQVPHQRSRWISLSFDKASHVSSKGNTSDFEGILSRVLHTSHKLKFECPEESDNLGRIWKPNGQYAKNGTKVYSSNKINYKGENSVHVSLASNFIAPEAVYQTTRVITNNSSKTFILEALFFNVT